MNIISILFQFSIVYINFLASVTEKNTKSGTDVNFNLYYKHNQNPIKIDASNVDAFETSGTKRITVVTHGYLANGATGTAKNLKNCVSKSAEDSEAVIVFDWGGYSGGEYNTVAQRVPQMGETLGKILVKLYNEKKVDPNNIHLIGHSLGSHVSSYAAQYFNDKANKKIGHLTGLDPAVPLFDDNGISRSDANWVDILRTSMLGIHDSERGHIVTCIDTKDSGCSLGDVACEHSYAADFYCNSINKRGSHSDYSQKSNRVVRIVPMVRLGAVIASYLIYNGYHSIASDLISSSIKPKKCQKCTPTSDNSGKYCEEDDPEPEPPICVPNRFSKMRPQ